MSKITRYEGNLRAFGSDAQGLERTLFGETSQADDLTSQVTASFLRGWGIVGASEHPSLEDFNAAMYAMSQFIAYQHQMGVPEWHAEQEYYLGSICTHNGESYQSLGNANVGNEPPSAAWTPILTARNGLANLGLTAITTVSGLTDAFPYFTSDNSAELTPLTSFARTLLSKPDDIDARKALGLGSAAKCEIGTTAGTVAAGNDSRFGKIIGVGQSWQDVAASRAAGVTYTNSTGRPILVIVSGRNTATTKYAYVDLVPVGGFTNIDAGTVLSSISFIVPEGSTYSISSGVSITGVGAGWSELR